MKKLLTLTAVGTLLTAPAIAVQKCVALDMDTTQCTASFTPSYSTEWSVNCTTDGVSVPITGIATCSSTAGSEEGEVVDTVEMPQSSGGNWYCWCKMISPAVSSWVFYSSMSYSFCWQKCADYCAYRTAGTYWFREGLFSSLSN